MEADRFLECVVERDIDLLLLEELHVCAAFRSWLINRAFGQDMDDTLFLSARHSISHTTLGESDLILLFEDKKRNKTALLIENKIAADPQPDQATRYKLRGEEGVVNGSWHRFRTCMVAPAAYLTGTNDAALYEALVSYEEIRDWFLHASENDARLAYKAAMVTEAIEQNRRGYRHTTHPGVTQFWGDYWRLACAEFPQLGMKKPGQIAAGSDWLEFRPPELSSQRRIIHKLEAGVVDLEIASAGDMCQKIAADNSMICVNGLTVVKTGKAASFRLLVPTVDRFGDVSLQVDAVRAGLSAAAQLLNHSPRIVVTRHTDAIE